MSLHAAIHLDDLIFGKPEFSGGFVGDTIPDILHELNALGNRKRTVVLQGSVHNAAKMSTAPSKSNGKSRPDLL